MKRQLYLENEPFEFATEAGFDLEDETEISWEIISPEFENGSHSGELENEWWQDWIAKAKAAIAQPAKAAPTASFGTLTATAPGRKPFSYKFTPEDALWTARFIVGEAGGRDDRDNQAVIWAMFNRYALFTHPYYKTFHQFIRAYSTPLQPVLKSAGAAKRHAHKPEFVKTGGTYEGTDIPRGQLDRFLKLQKTPWDKLPATARSLAERGLKGQISNPIGNASEFASTRVYFRDRHKRWPKDFEEWRRFTESFAASKKWKWVGPVSGIDQMKNAFFIQKKVESLPSNTVRVTIGASASDQEFPFVSSFLSSLKKPAIIDRTAVALRTNRKGTRDMKKVYALVLHQTAFSRGNDPTKYDRIPVHFVITPDGKIIQLHPLSAYLWSSNGFNARSVAVEFVGNFRSVEGRYYKPENFGCHPVTPAQIKAGRELIQYLIKEMGLTHVLAHRQSSGMRTNDPGPEVWYNVGQWAVDNLGLKDGGPGFKIDTGAPIPNEWRTWGSIAASRPVPASSTKRCKVYRGK